MQAKLTAGYRNDIDVLRALAVTLVVLYHVGFTSFSGGFVGVDVFFVISGYLITNVLVSDIEKGRFSFAAFYNRRLWRLLPALFFVVAVTFIVGAILLPPQHFKSLSRSTVFSFFGAANFDFWLQSGYFDADAIKKPLLHIWSLAVEIQFYAVWPMVVFLCFMKSRSRTLLAIVTVTALACSFGAAVYTMQAEQTAAFFMMPFRLWEFCAGGIVFLTHHHFSGVKSDMAYVAGFGAILWSALTYTDDTPFPGLNAAAPVIGSALMLYGGTGQIAKALQNRATTYLGNISYSVYLAHWPLIVFYVLKAQEVSTTARFSLIAASLILGSLSYNLIENRFRKPRELHIPRFALVSAVFAAFIASASHAAATNGWIWRMPSEVRRAYNLDKPAADEYTFANIKRLNADDDYSYPDAVRKVLIIGDSQAGDLTNLVLQAGLPDGVAVSARVITNRCGVPISSKKLNDQYWNDKNPFSMKDHSLRAKCEDDFERIVSSKVFSKADKIVIAMLWREYSIPYVQSIVDEIHRRTSAEIYVVGNKRFSASSLDLMEQNGSLKNIEEFARHKAIGERDNVKLKEISNAKFIDPFDYICAGDKCRVFTDKSYPVFMDTSHFTREGVLYLVKNIDITTIPFLKIR